MLELFRRYRITTAQGQSKTDSSAVQTSNNMKIPAYRLHKRTGQAVVALPVGGRRQDTYLGVYDTASSRLEYDRTIAIWMRDQAARPVSPPVQPVPALLLHSTDGRAYVNVSTHGSIYLAQHGTTEATQRYAQFIAEWLANNRIVPSEYHG